MHHLDDTRLIAAAEGGASDADRDHIAGCEHCTRRVEELGAIVAALARAGAHDPEPPAGVLAWARAYARSAAVSRRWSVLEVLAVGARPLAGVRGPGEAASALFGDTHHQIDVRLTHAGPGTVDVRGQVVPLGTPTGTRWRVRLVTADGVAAEATAEDGGDFRLRGVRLQAPSSLVADGDDGTRLVVARIAPEEDAASA